ncbi:hypothetical protein CMV_019836 [Castanea mollissima]|uniref:Uncharacterized protein n=1 Tax=Castanea mollissima TaxID=60419 RepID=A0A8J4QXE6_9ROSI|nr:hypothetical protein CMV_019836 [Castanea mollissima]
MLVAGRVLVGFSLPSSVSLEAMSTLELEELEARRAGGYTVKSTTLEDLCFYAVEWKTRQKFRYHAGANIKLIAC